MGYSNSKAQIITKVYSTKFQPETVGFNGSPDPNECWDSVAWGIKIKTENGYSFFNMGFNEIERLKPIIKNSKVQIEVNYYSEPLDGSGAVGSVLKITLKGEVIYHSQEL